MTKNPKTKKENKVRKSNTGNLKSVLQELLEIKNTLAEQSYTSLEERSRKLRNELEKLEEYDLLLTLYNWMFDCAYTENQTEIDKTVLESYVSVTQKAGIKQEHIDQLLSVQILLSAAENGNPDRASLLESYTQLAKLLVRHENIKLKYQVLINILRICPFLENRDRYIEPYIEFVRHHLGEIITHFPEEAHTLYYTLAVYGRRESLFTRMAFIDQAIELASNHVIPDKESYYRLIKSELHCDDGDFKSAIKELDIVDHIIFTNSHFGDQLKNISALSHITRFLIAFLLEMQQIKISNGNYNLFLKKIEESGKHWSDFDARINELKSLLMIKKGHFKKAASLIREAFLLREKNIHPQLSQINLLLHELMKEKPEYFWINERIDELEKTNELFYSSVWAGILRGIIDLMPGQKN